LTYEILAVARWTVQAAHMCCRLKGSLQRFGEFL
jgi:hypothetical protein